MLLTDNMANRQIIGCLMLNPLLLLEYQDIEPIDFDVKIARICFLTIKRLYKQGASSLTPIEIDQDVEKYGASAIEYRKEGGLEYVKSAYEFAEINNFEMYYNRLKKYSLLRRLKKEKYDISEFYLDDKDVDDPYKEIKIQEHLDESSLEEILNSVEGKLNNIRNEFLQGGKLKADPSEGIDELIESLRKAPSIGPSLEGKYFSSACRGARPGCFFLKSASTNAGKTRTSVFDACHLAYPVRWSADKDKECFIKEVDTNGVNRIPRKVLFIVTEMDKEELQTIMLAYLSGVDEDHILRGDYEFGELDRVKFAAKIMKQYSGFFIIEEIGDPNLTNVEATIRKYATVDNVKYVFFDYIHTTSSMISQFSKNNLREDVVLMMMANQLKQLAKDYKIFIFSATQVNASAMMDDGEFKNEACIRGSKAVADKADMGYVMTRVTERLWNSVLPTLRKAAREGYIDADILENPNRRPTHIIDIYKMRGKYKNVRIWTHIHLGTGHREDSFMTSMDNSPFPGIIELFSSVKEQTILDWRNHLD